MRGWALLRAGGLRTAGPESETGAALREVDPPTRVTAPHLKPDDPLLTWEGEGRARRPEPLQLRAMRWQRDLARAEAERWRLEREKALRERDTSDARRVALIDSLAVALPEAVLGWRMRGWDEGWEAARADLPKRQNPHRLAAAAPAEVDADG